MIPPRIETTCHEHESWEQSWRKFSRLERLAEHPSLLLPAMVIPSYRMIPENLLTIPNLSCSRRDRQWHSSGRRELLLETAEVHHRPVARLELAPSYYVTYG